MSDEGVKGADTTVGEEAVHGWWELELSGDLMEARLRFRVPEGGRVPTLEEARELLAEKGVAHGVDMGVITRLLEQGEAGQWAVVARGTPPVDGRDGYIELRFSVEKRQATPVHLEDGRTDFYNLGIVENARKGDVLAVKHLPVPGTPGVTVTGNPVNCRDGKGVSLRAGRNVEITQDGLEAVALMDGQPVVDKSGRISVVQVYTVRGDVDFRTGNVDFVGSVKVTGNVREGFTVRAEQDIEVGGHVYRASLQAGGSIVIRGGIQGRGREGIRAGLDVAARFIENAAVEAGRDVRVNEAIMHSAVTCGGSVCLTGKRGLIVGGTVRAGGEVRARVIGSSLATPTEVEVGVDPGLRRELSSVVSELEQFTRLHDDTKKAAGLLKGQLASGSLPEEKRNLALRLTRSLFQLAAKCEELATRKAWLEEQMAGSVKGKVSARDIIYPGVKVTIGNASVLVRDEHRHCTMRLSEAREVEARAYEG